MTKKLFLLVLMVILSPRLVADEKVRVALLDLQSKNVEEKLTLAVSDFLRVELINTGAYDVLDRDNMKLILKEQAFQQSGCTDAACAVEVGQILNCEKMFVGALSKIGRRYFLSIQRVDVETAKVDFANKVEAKDEDGLPEAAAELAAGMVKGEARKTKKRRRGEGDEIGRRVKFEVGFGGTDVAFCYELYQNDQNGAGDAGPLPERHKMRQGVALGLRYYPRSIAWLGLGVFTIIGSSGVDDLNCEHGYESAAGFVVKRTQVDKLRVQPVGGRIFLDSSRFLGLPPKSAQLVLGYAVALVSWSESYEFGYGEVEPGGGSDAGDASVPMIIVSGAFRYNRFEAMLGLIGWSDDQEVFRRLHDFAEPDDGSYVTESSLIILDKPTIFVTLNLML